MGQGWCCKFVK